MLPCNYFCISDIGVELIFFKSQY